jgi:hypothetical protein
LELPIDHFRLLGVNPATDAQAVLHTLQQRLDRLPEQGFTAETIQARAELLRASADLLSDPERRGDYEASLTALAAREPAALAALDIPSTKDVGGLLLLLEAGQALDCFELAQRSLQPPRAPALGSGREADLALLAGLACLAAAADLHQQRRYESAAQTLQQGQQLLQRIGQQPLLRQQLQEELDGLQPFRVLDLLSRDLTATDERREGLALLDALVQRRGGLEGDGDPRLPRPEFQAFFKQIRSFLTVQEQMDLFSRWGDHSSAAHFLATTALTASGFARRKPEQIATALQRLQASGQEGTQPLQACLQLLLGKVDQGLALFAGGAPPDLRAWAEAQSDDPLAQLCAYTRDWLARDVLPGYRDLEADPDLEAYFADRDVQTYVEQHDRPAPAPGDRRRISNPFAGWVGGLEWGGGAPAPAEPGNGELPAATSGTWDPSEAGTVLGDTEPVEPELDELLSLDLRLWLDDWLADRRAQLEAVRDRLPSLRPPSFQLPQLQRLRWQARPPWNNQRWLGLTAVAAVLAAAGGALLLRGRQAPPTPIPVQRAALAPATRPPTSVAAKPAPAARPLAAAPLTAAEPTEAQLKGLLEAWLAAKAAVLAGGDSSIPLGAMGRSSQVSRVLSERQSDAARNETQRISTSVQSLDIEERGPRRIAVIANLSYRDQRLDGASQAVGQPTSLQLRNRYVFARDGERWLLASFQRAD